MFQQLIAVFSYYLVYKIVFQYFWGGYTVNYSKGEINTDSVKRHSPIFLNNFLNAFLIKTITIKTDCKRITQRSISMLELLFASTPVITSIKN